MQALSVCTAPSDRKTRGILATVTKTNHQTHSQRTVAKLIKAVVSTASEIWAGVPTSSTSDRKSPIFFEPWKKSRRSLATIWRFRSPLFRILPLRAFSIDLFQSGFILSCPRLLYSIGSVEPVAHAPVLTNIVSLIALLSALYVILSRKYSPKVEQWAYATVAMILGFWLRQA